MKNYSFRVLVPYNEETKTLNPPTNLRNSIFLAGPCPRFDYEDDWRYTAFDILEELGFRGTVITPTNDKYSDMERHQPETLWAQTEWERTMMHICSALVFWVPRCEKWPAFTTNVEFGEWYKKPGVYFGFPEDATRMKYLTLKFTEQKKTWYNDLKKMLSDVVKDLQKSPERKWFTSDTHFGQQRTLELSCRPFADLVEMDLTIMSNWNKVVRPDDVVYHAGDFGEVSNQQYVIDLLSNLNFKKLYWTLGNYDRKAFDQIKTIVDAFNQVNEGKRSIELFDHTQTVQPVPGGLCEVELTNAKGETFKFAIIHEPVDFPAPSRDGVTYLYGHIHGRSFAKRNGFDLATDYHRYTPLSEEQVLWFKNAMQYWDENVYTDTVKVAE